MRRRPPSVRSRWPAARQAILWTVPKRGTPRSEQGRKHDAPPRSQHLTYVHCQPSRNPRRDLTPNANGNGHLSAAAYARMHCAVPSACPANCGPDGNADDAPRPCRCCDSPPRILRALGRALTIGPVAKSRERIAEGDTRAHAHDTANHCVSAAIGTACRLLTHAKHRRSNVDWRSRTHCVSYEANWRDALRLSRGGLQCQSDHSGDADDKMPRHVKGQEKWV